MGMYVGDSDNLVLMLGGTEVSAAYLGDTQVYPMSPFAVSPSRISLNNVQLTANLRIKSPEAWTITDTSGGWLTLSANSGTAGVTVVTVTATTATADRTASITVTTANYSKTVSVSQVMFNFRYLHLHNLTNQTGTMTLGHNSHSGGSVIKGFDLDYSYDSYNWVTTDPTQEVSVQVPANGYIFLRGSEVSNCFINLDVDHSAGGNLLSILTRTDFDTVTSWHGHYYMNLDFCGDEHLVDVSKLDFGNFTDANACFQYLFEKCYGLTEGVRWGDILPVGRPTWYHTYENCRNLSVAYAPKVAAWDNNNYDNWLNGVAATGIVVMDPSTTGVPTNSVSGIPTGWTRVDSYYSVTLDATNGNAMDYATSDGRSGSVTAGNTATVRLDYPQTLSITTGGTRDHLYVNGVDKGNGPSYTLDYLDLSNGDTLTVVHTNEPS